MQALFARVDSLAIIFWWQWPLRFWTEDRNNSGRVGQTAALTAEGQVAPGGAGFCTQPKGYFNCIVSFRRLRNYHSCSSKKMAKTAISLSNSGVTVRKGRTLAELPNEFAEKQRRGGRLFFSFLSNGGPQTVATYHNLMGGLNCSFINLCLSLPPLNLIPIMGLSASRKKSWQKDWATLRLCALVFSATLSAFAYKT